MRYRKITERNDIKKYLVWENFFYKVIEVIIEKFLSRFVSSLFLSNFILFCVFYNLNFFYFFVLFSRCPRSVNYWRSNGPSYIRYLLVQQTLSLSLDYYSSFASISENPSFTWVTGKGEKGKLDSTDDSNFIHCWTRGCTLNYRFDRRHSASKLPEIEFTKSSQSRVAHDFIVMSFSFIFLKVDSRLQILFSPRQ